MSDGVPRVAQFEIAADTIVRRIRTGQLKPGDKLPPHTELASELGVAVGTLRRALKELESGGWLYSRPTVGVFVNEPPQEPEEQVTLAQLAQEVEALRERVERLEAGQ
ncbi:winged helix-turn-helix domain-containing protein [Amycolatopsis sp. NPDC050768]|uniref:GntR family transcriptional regulator n=1 Tax=Amycolatopsis sp. NPDC050768 TaxID=3154839 RepID=UPI0033D6F1BB